MNGLHRAAGRVGLAIAVLLTVLFAVFLINQTAAIVQLAGGVSPTLGRAALWGLMTLYAILLAVPAIMLLRLPRPLELPRSDDPATVEKYRRALTKRLQKNPRLRGQPLETKADVEAALANLASAADTVISATAGSVFVGTAISQYGRLDALVVLAAQTRMVWQVAHIFNQRPAVRDMVRLYANVGSTVFIASEIDDVDVAEQMEPIISSVLGSLAGSVPGVQLVAGLIVNSALTGSANAFLTLRVGVITKKYSTALVREEKRSVKRSATIEAARLLRSIAASGTRNSSGGLLRGFKGQGSSGAGLGNAERDECRGNRHRQELRGGLWRGQGSQSSGRSSR